MTKMSGLQKLLRNAPGSRDEPGWISLAAVVRTLTDITAILTGSQHAVLTAFNVPVSSNVAPASADAAQSNRVTEASRIFFGRHRPSAYSSTQTSPAPD